MHGPTPKPSCPLLRQQGPSGKAAACYSQCLLSQAMPGLPLLGEVGPDAEQGQGLKGAPPVVQQLQAGADRLLPGLIKGGLAASALAASAWHLATVRDAVSPLSWLAAGCCEGPVRARTAASGVGRQ